MVRAILAYIQAGRVVGCGTSVRSVTCSLKEHKVRLGKDKVSMSESVRSRSVFFSNLAHASYHQIWLNSTKKINPDNLGLTHTTVRTIARSSADYRVGASCTNQVKTPHATQENIKKSAKCPAQTHRHDRGGHHDAEGSNGGGDDQLLLYLRTPRTLRSAGGSTNKQE